MSTKAERFLKLATELFETLEGKDAQIHVLRAQLKARLADLESEWMLPKEFNQNQNDLPVPRLEVRCHNYGDWSHYTWVYGLFHKHLDGRFLLLPMWMSKVSSGAGKPVRNGRPLTPRGAERLIRYDMTHFGLPGFVIVDGLVEALESAPDRPPGVEME